MKHYLKSTAMRLLGDVRGVVVIGQNGDGEGITQSKDGFGCSAVAAEIIDNDREPRVRSFSAGIFRTHIGRECCARHDFDFEYRHAYTSKLKLKEISGLNRRILRQMIPGRDGIETLNELCDYSTVRICRRIILQHDTQVIRGSGLVAGSALPELNGGTGRYCGSGRNCQIARDLVNLRGCEAVLFALFATTAKNREKEANSPQRESCWEVYLDSKAVEV